MATEKAVAERDIFKERPLRYLGECECLSTSVCFYPHVYICLCIRIYARSFAGQDTRMKLEKPSVTRYR